MNPQAKQNLQIESEPLRQLLSQLLESQNQVRERLSPIDQIQEQLSRIDQIQEQLSQINQIREQLSQIDQEVKAWGGWLRTASGAVLFVVSISFLGAFFGLLLPIALELWRSRV